MIYLVRHGQTEFNVARRYQGQLDSPLTARGESQARRMGERLGELLAGAGSVRFVTSPLGRAVATAELIRPSLPGAPQPELDPRLAEVAMGAWDGLTFEQLQARKPDGVDQDERYFHGPGGEDWDGFSARLADWLASVQPDETVVAVTHGVASRVLRGLYLDMPRQRMLRLDVPQNVVFRLGGGRIQRFDCGGD